MTTPRRRVLQILGGGVIVAAGGGAAFLGTRTPQRALSPWARAGSAHTDPRMQALSWAILAPNPHNRQPWVVRLDGDEGFTLFAQADRRLPHTDPFDRQITIGLGCFLEIARMAAAEQGFTLAVEAFPEGEPAPTLDHRPVARASLVADGAAADPLFPQVALRRSCKEPFDMARPLTPQRISALEGVVSRGSGFGAALDTRQVAALRDLGWRAHEIESRTPRTYMESVELMRIGKSEIEASPDGIDLGGPFLEALNLVGLLTREQLSDMTSEAYRQGMEMYRALFEATPAFVWLSTPGNTRRHQLAAGADWVRLNLAATAAGLALHPVSQALQEYPEMASLLEEAHTRLQAGPGERVQMLGRLGHGPSTPPSPRWPLAARIHGA